MPFPSIIAIDGPAASGKSTIGKRLADTLGYLFFDTGVMYRAITWLVLQRGLDLDDEPAITYLAETVLIDVQPPSRADGRACDVIVEGVSMITTQRSEFNAILSSKGIDELIAKLASKSLSAEVAAKK